MLDARDKLAMKETFARLEFFAETLAGEDLINFSRQLNDKLLFVRRRIAETGTGSKKVLRINPAESKIAAGLN